MARYVASGDPRGMPSAQVTAVGRQSARHYLRLLDTSLARLDAPPITEAEVVRSQAAIRSAAVRVSVFRLYRNRLERAAVWFFAPLCAISVSACSYFAVIYLVSDPMPTIVVAAALVSFGTSIATLILVIALNSVRLHFFLSVVLAGGAVLAAANLPSRQASLGSAIVGFCIVPAAVYLASTPLIFVAYVAARRLIRAVDPRARIVVRLVQCIHQTTMDVSWMHQKRARDIVVLQLERIARIAERDLPRLMPGPVSDPVTADWLKMRGRLIAAEVRQHKRTVVLPSGEEHVELSRRLIRLLVHACLNEWDQLCAEEEPPKTRGVARKIFPYLGAAFILVVAGLIIPSLFSANLTDSGQENLRSVLILSGLVSLIPIPRNPFEVIPDAFADTVRLG